MLIYETYIKLLSDDM